MTASPETRILPLDDAALALAARAIQCGQAVAVPTETVYGLAADATDAHAVGHIYAAKGRPSFNPLIVHVADRDMASRLAEMDAVALALAEHFWPGPLTLVLPARSDAGLASQVMAGLPTVALRCPAHPAIRQLIALSGRPLAAPSANASGQISPTTAAHVARSLNGRIGLILDGGPTTQGLESTIVAPAGGHLRLLRPGPVTVAMLEDVSGLPVRSAQGGGIEAPGQLASHYAPSKPVRLNAMSAGADEFLIGFGDMMCDYNLSASGDLEEAAARLYDALHVGDASGKAAIAVTPMPADGLGAAINDRLARAAA